MKRMIIFALSVLPSGILGAQTIYEASNMLDKDINGTARFVGMGGAMNALGGDISVISSNPAGIGIYRSNDISISMGPNIINSKFAGTESKKNMFSFDNFGFVYTGNLGKKSKLRFVNFAFSYNKRKNFNARYSGVWNDRLSQTNLFADMASNGVNKDGRPGFDTDQFESSYAYVNDAPYIGWLPIMAYNAYLINPKFESDGSFKGVWSGFERQQDMTHKYEIDQAGWINDYDFNMSFNVADNVYLGATLKAVDVKYSMRSLYKEDFFSTNNGGMRVSDGGYDISNFFSTSGAGIGFSLGTIIRLTPTLRLGFSFSTPTLYMLTDYQETTLAYDVDVLNPETGKYERKAGSVYPVDADNAPMSYQYNYRVRTPWRINLSLGTTLFRRLAIDAEYEYTDASKSRIMYEDGTGIDVLNKGYNISGTLMGGTSQALKKQHTARIGAEFRVLPSVSVRAGYNYVTSLTDDSAFKLMESGSARADTEYVNLKDKSSYSFGIGYARRMFYADFAYQMINYNAEFFAFDNLDMKAMDLNTKRHQILFTLGLRF